MAPLSGQAADRIGRPRPVVFLVLAPRPGHFSNGRSVCSSCLKVSLICSAPSPSPGARPFRLSLPSLFQRSTSRDGVRKRDK